MDRLPSIACMQDSNENQYYYWLVCTTAKWEKFRTYAEAEFWLREKGHI